MASRVINNCGQMVLRWAAGTRSWNNVYGMIGQPTLPVFTQTLANTLDTAIKGQVAASGLAPLLGPTVQLVSVSIRSLTAPNQAEFVGAGAPASGTGTGDLLPLNTAACVTLRTALAGKSFRGRSYIAGFTESQNDATGRIVAAANTAAVAFVQGIVSTLSANGMGMAVLSFERDPVTIPAKDIPGKAGFGNTVTALIARNTKWESQRRRTGRV